MSNEELARWKEEVIGMALAENDLHDLLILNYITLLRNSEPVILPFEDVATVLGFMRSHKIVFEADGLRNIAIFYLEPRGMKEN